LPNIKEAQEIIENMPEWQKHLVKLGLLTIQIPITLGNEVKDDAKH
jgi:hypothetical protein